ncbi:MAG: transcriptional repressor LexA [Patescibacteria group bacterium]|nr:transcriptional repressor LexA [Patescibacteria group bacterium]
MITLRQKQILDFITDFSHKKSFAPTLEEIKEHLGLSAVSTVHHHVRSLKDAGFLSKEEHQPRAISVYESEQMMQIPFLGIISAGKPIEAIEQKETMAYPKTRLPKSGRFYALRVNGQSMIDENIADGDIVIIKVQPAAENGQKVVALINNEEVTLKKIYKEKNKIRLQPANPELEPIYVPAEKLTIQGVVIDVVKKQSA